jgi:hypothetical protein
MTERSLQAETLAALIDHLIAEKDPRIQERILIEEICEAGWAQSAGLLRTETSKRSGWIEILSRGPIDLLPTADQVAAIDEGQLDTELPLGKRTFFASNSSGRVALTLGGCRQDSETEDLLAALLEVFSRFSTERGDPVWGEVDLLDILQPPMPSEPENKSEGQEDD